MTRLVWKDAVSDAITRHTTLHFMHWTDLSELCAMFCHEHFACFAQYKRIVPKDGERKGGVVLVRET